MGMRAVIAYRNTNNIVTSTTVQWSSYIDTSLGKVLNAVESRGESKQDFITEMMETLTQFSHISALGLYEPNDSLHYSESLCKGIEVDGKAYDFGISSPDGSARAQSSYTDEPLVSIIAKHPHAQDGICVYYDAARDPETVYTCLVEGTQGRKDEVSKAFRLV